MTGILERPALLYIFHSGNLYGMERMALATMSALPEYRRQIVMAPPGSAEAGSALAAAQAAGLDAVPFEGRSHLIRQLRSVLAQHRQVDVVTSSITQSIAVAAVARSTRTSIRHLHAVHGSGREHQYRWKPALLPLRLRYVAVSQHVRAELERSHVPASRVVVVENFLEPPASGFLQRPSYQSRPIGLSGPPRIVVVGRADPIKRLDLVIEGARLLPDVAFDVYGAGPELASLRSASDSLANLTFHGFDPEVGRQIADADLLVHTCPIEAFGLVVLEAFGAGVVPVVPDQGGTADLVEPGVTGLLFRAGDAADLADRIRTAVSMDPTELDDLSVAGHRLMATRFSVAQGAQSYRAAFNQLGD